MKATRIKNSCDIKVLWKSGGLYDGLKEALSLMDDSGVKPLDFMEWSDDKSDTHCLLFLCVKDLDNTEYEEVEV